MKLRYIDDVVFLYNNTLCYEHFISKRYGMFVLHDYPMGGASVPVESFKTLYRAKKKGWEILMSNYTGLIKRVYDHENFLPSIS